MTISSEGDQDAGILAAETIFPPGATICKMHVSGVGPRANIVEIDTVKSITSILTLFAMKKVVITVLKGPKIINICAEGSMMEVLMRFVLSTTSCPTSILIQA